VQRRKFLRNAGAAGAALLAGCSAEPTDGGSDSTTAETTETTTAETTTEGTTTGTTTQEPETLRVATYPSYVDAPSSSAGAYLKEEFDSRFDATLEWVPQEEELNYYIQRRQQGADIDADAYAGVRQMDLVRIEQQLDDALFQETQPSALPNGQYIKDAYRFDADQRVIPTGGSYVSLVYDEEVVTPETYDDIASASETLLLPSPGATTTGRMFLLMTIHEFGEDGYLDYWERLNDNLTVTGDWGSAYAAYENREAPMIMSYSTDQVYASRGDAPMSRHQVGFPNGQGYSYIGGAARFADAEHPELANEFLNFLLEPDIQARAAELNVGIPATTNADTTEEYAQYVYEPETTVRFSKERLANNLDSWTSEWSRQFASN
jgi:thiamine transport system substrate-binding protein